MSRIKKVALHGSPEVRLLPRARYKRSPARRTGNPATLTDLNALARRTRRMEQRVEVNFAPHLGVQQSQFWWSRAQRGVAT